MKWFWWLLFCLVPGVVQGQMSMKMSYSPDTSVAVRVATMQEKGGVNRESALEFWSRREGKLLSKNFISRDHSQGFGVMKSFWSLDSRYFIFSMMASGGREAGWFPTWIFSSADKRLFSLDSLVGRRVIDPEFVMENVDSVAVTFAGTLTSRGPVDTVSLVLSIDSLLASPRKPIKPDNSR
jgi:hypothetical protein